MDGATTPHELTRVNRSGRTDRRVDLLVTEAPIEFRLDGVPLAVLMRTPGHDAELGLGFAITEGIVLDPGEMADVIPAVGNEAGDRWSFVLSDGVTVDPEQFRRNLYTTSSCGVCGKASIDAVRVAARRPPPGPRVSSEVLLSLTEKMAAAQPGFAATGGIHAAALFDGDGQMLASREDIGRHNAVDKVVGYGARMNWPIGERILLVSGRVSFEIVQKAAVAGIPIVAGVSAASSLAVELGEELGLTVIGFLREDSYNIYTDEDRCEA
ncbi:MAG: formate dehydrogenase accessory sulfurtransferase FdhD [bacterium]|nr:formate dehydrogenase accessory sulfurtransferase FdhD [bacterium]